MQLCACCIFACSYDHVRGEKTSATKTAASNDDTRTHSSQTSNCYASRWPVNLHSGASSDVTSAMTSLDRGRCTESNHATAEGAHTHTHPFNGPLSGTTWVSRYQKGKTNLDFTEARDSEWQWHQLGHIQVCTSLQRQITTPAPHHSVFYRPGALPAA